MRTLLLTLLLLAVTPAAAAPIPVVTLHHPEPVSYEREIIPLLDAKCAACHSGSVRRGQYDVSSHESLLKRGKHGPAVEAVALAPDGTTLASGGFREVYLWDTATGALARRVTGFADRVVALAFSPDGKLLATGGGPATEDGEVKLIDVTTGKVVAEIANAHSDTVYGVAFSPDGRTLATAAADKFVKTFEVPSGKFVRSFEGHGGHALDVAWSADGRQLASAGADGAIKLWDFASGESVRTFGGPGRPVVRLAFDGGRLLAAGG